ncbi:ABC transporter permease [Candidatus Poriferisocius sp.]|uniref:ABC transporter permease n=1 Tax=Candidatus Poriferisocius sp. TaxID=3101276 RepID=UPI003B02B0EC
MAGSSLPSNSGQNAERIVREPGPAERMPRRASRRRRSIELTLAVAFPAVLIGLWQVASGLDWIDGRLYPSPTEIIAKTRTLFADRDLASDAWISVRRILWGYLWGVLGGLSFGIGMGMFRLMRKTGEPTLIALYTVPKLALLPIYLTIFGFGETTIIALIATTVFFFVWLSAMAAVMAVPETYREAASSFGAGRWLLFRHVMLPAALPSIFVGLRLSAGVAVLMIVGVEFVIGGEGLGYVINQGRLLGLIEQTYVGIVIVAVIGVVFSALVRFAGKLACPWSNDDQGQPIA